MNLAEMRGRMNAASTELSDLWKKEERSTDEESRVDALIAELNDLGPQIERAAKVEGHIAANTSQRQSAGRVSGIVPVAGAEEREAAAREFRTLGERFSESEQVKHFREHGGRRSDPMG